MFFLTLYLIFDCTVLLWALYAILSMVVIRMARIKAKEYRGILVKFYRDKVAKLVGSAGQLEDMVSTV